MRNRVRSKIHAAHTGTVITETAGTFAVLWDGGGWSYLHASEFIWIDSLTAVHA